jgi:hypothetical protein
MQSIQAHTISPAEREDKWLEKKEEINVYAEGLDDGLVGVYPERVW